uniref:Uncharacterized protein n=1 Tax=Glossina pallidipes TaxID=7398 RepID=A0A1B0ACR8_GLOPL
MERHGCHYFVRAEVYEIVYKACHYNMQFTLADDVNQQYEYTYKRGDYRLRRLRLVENVPPETSIPTMSSGSNQSIMTWQCQSEDLFSTVKHCGNSGSILYGYINKPSLTSTYGIMNRIYSIN